MSEREEREGERKSKRMRNKMRERGGRERKSKRMRNKMRE